MEGSSGPTKAMTLTTEQLEAALEHARRSYAGVVRFKAPANQGKIGAVEIEAYVGGVDPWLQLGRETVSVGGGYQPR